MSTYEARLAALREQLKADRLDGFVVPLTDEHMCEYVGSYAQRLAWLTGFQGSAGSAVVLPEEAAIFTDGRYTLQVRDQVDGRHWSLPVGAGDQRRRLAQGARSRRRPDRLRSLAPHQGLGVAGRRRRWPRRAPSWSPSSATRSTPSGRTSPSPPRRGWPSTPTISPASRRPPSARRWPTGCGSRRPTRRCSRRSIRSPGPSTSAARTSSIRRSPSPSRWSMTTAPPTCSSPRRRSATTSASISATAFGSTSAHDFEPHLRALAGKTVVADPERAVARHLRSARESRRQDRPEARPRGASQGDQEPGRDRGPPRRPGPRRRGPEPLPPLAVGRGAERRRSTS